MKLRMLCCLLVSASLLAGCGGSKTTASKSFTSATYKVNFSYPDSWMVKELNEVEDQKAKTVKIVLFHKHDGMGTPEARELPPMVVVRWHPAQQVDMPAAPEGDPNGQPGRLIVGIPESAEQLTAGWNEFGAENIQSRDLQIAGMKAFEATAVAKPGTAFVAVFGGQLVGPDQMYRVVAIPSSSGYYEIIRVAPKGSDELVEADKIVDSLSFTP